MKSALVTEVIRGLNLARGDWSRIAEEAGASYSWVSKLVCGEIHKPGAPTVERIYLALVRRGHLSPNFSFMECDLMIADRDGSDTTRTGSDFPERETSHKDVRGRREKERREDDRRDDERRDHERRVV